MNYNCHISQNSDNHYDEFKHKRPEKNIVWDPDSVGSCTVYHDRCLLIREEVKCQLSNRSEQIKKRSKIVNTCRVSKLN